MALDFATIPQRAYPGTLNKQAAQTSQTLLGCENNLPPTAVVARVPWASFGDTNANIQTQVNLMTTGSGGSNPQMLDKILSVRIDNLGMPVPCYVQFPDSGFTLVCPANSIIWQPVKTGGFVANIIAKGFTQGDLDTVPPPVSTVTFYNIEVPPSISAEINQSASLWLQSADVQRGGSDLKNNNFGIPALGDQTVQAEFTLSGFAPVPLFGGSTDPEKAFIYITSIQVNALSLPFDGAVTEFVIESTGAAGILFAFIFINPSLVTFPNSLDFDYLDAFTFASDIQVGAGATVGTMSGSGTTTQAVGNNSYIGLMSLGSMNLRLDGTQSWQVAGLGGTGGVGTVYLQYTTNPI